MIDDVIDWELRLEKLNANFISGDIIDSEHVSESLMDFDICIH